MAILGKMNPLKVVKTVDFGVYLDGGSDGEILLPTRYVPENCEIGDTLSVFIYTDSEDRLIATTVKPYAMVGEFACLEVEAVNEVGAFLDWGLMKQLLVPFREQHAKMREGGRYPVFVYVDFESKRITASAKLEKFIDESRAELEAGQEVELMIYKKQIWVGRPLLTSNTVVCSIRTRFFSLSRLVRSSPVLSSKSGRTTR